MRTNVSGHHIGFTPALKNYVTNKLNRLQCHFDHVANTHVVLSVEKARQKAEATVHVSGSSLPAEAVERGMYAAIDGLTDKLDRQFKRHKEKLTDYHRKRRV